MWSSPVFFTGYHSFSMLSTYRRIFIEDYILCDWWRRWVYPGFRDRNRIPYTGLPEATEYHHYPTSQGWRSRKRGQGIHGRVCLYSPRRSSNSANQIVDPGHWPVRRKNMNSLGAACWGGIWGVIVSIFFLSAPQQQQLPPLQKVLSLDQASSIYYYWEAIGLSTKGGHVMVIFSVTFALLFATLAFFFPSFGKNFD